MSVRAGVGRAVFVPAIAVRLNQPQVAPGFRNRGNTLIIAPGPLRHKASGDVVLGGPLGVRTLTEVRGVDR